MQPGFDRSNRNACQGLDFGHFVALSIVQKHDKAMLITESRQGRIQSLYVIHTLIIVHGIFTPRQALHAITRELSVFDRVQSPPGEAPLFVDKKVVHDAREPGSGLLDPDEVVELVERSYQEFLEKVFRLGFATGQAPRETVQAVEVRSDQPLECQCVFVRGIDGQGPFSMNRYSRSDDIPCIRDLLEIAGSDR